MSTAILSSEIINNNSGSKKAPEYIRILPIGPTLALYDGRELHLTEAQEVIHQSLRDEVDLVIDYEHSSLSQDKQACPAAGWIKALEVKDDGIYARVEWAKKAKDMIESSEYRYVSPVLHFIQDANGRKNITKILNVALTNTPALEMKDIFMLSEQSTSTNSQDIEQIAQLLDLNITHPSQLLSAIQAHKASSEIAACQLDVESVIKDCVFPRACEVELLTLRQAVGNEQFVSLSKKLAASGFGYAHLNKGSQFEALKEKGVLPDDTQKDNFGLTDLELEVCKNLGVKPEDYIKIKGKK